MPRIRYLLQKLRVSARIVLDGVHYALFGVERRRLVPVDLLHPDPEISPCKCYGTIRKGTEHHSDHEEECAWLALRCESCGGAGWCSACGGSGDEPPPPPLVHGVHHADDERQPR